MKKKNKGFSIVELMIVLAIISVLAAAAIPAYQNYTQNTRLVNAITSMAGVQMAISECYLKFGNLDTCDHNRNGIPHQNDLEKLPNVTDVVVNDGNIKVTSNGVNAEGDNMWIRLEPNVIGGVIYWREVGNGCTLSNSGATHVSPRRGIECDF